MGTKVSSKFLDTSRLWIDNNYKHKDKNIPNIPNKDFRQKSLRIKVNKYEIISLEFK